MNKRNIAHLVQDENIRRITFYVFILVSVVFLGVYGWIYYREYHEKKVSMAINDLIDRKAQLVFEKEQSIQESGGDSFSYIQNLTELGKEFYQIFEQNSGYQEGLRALYFSANIDFELEKYEQAEKKYRRLFEIDSSHFLAPSSIFHLVIIDENRGQYMEAIDWINQFNRLYLGHYLEGEFLLAKARNYYFLGQPIDADKILQDILQNESLTAYYDSAQEWMNLIKIDQKLNQLDNDKESESSNK